MLHKTGDDHRVEMSWNPVLAEQERDLALGFSHVHPVQQPLPHAVPKQKDTFMSLYAGHDALQTCCAEPLGPKAL